MNDLVCLWQGIKVSEDEFKKFFYEKKDDINFWSRPPLDHELLFALIENLLNILKDRGAFYHLLFDDLKKWNDISIDEIEELMESLENFLSVDNLRLKLFRELGSEHPFELKKINPRFDHFEAWYPMGVLAHITPNNSPLLSVLGVFEGLLSGNVNILKLAHKDTMFAILFYEKLCQLDLTDTIKNYIYITKASSKDKKYLSDLISIADVISVWGSEETVKSIKEMASPSIKIVAWGHKISFAYITKSTADLDKMIHQLAFEICHNEQMACSSPQCVFLEDASLNDLKKFSLKLSHALDLVSPAIKRIIPNSFEKAEITVTTEQVRLSSIMNDGESEVMVSSHNDWRILIENSSNLKTSPLYRTIWIKPISKNKMVEVLKPFKAYLQTAGVSALKEEIESLAKILFQANVLRIRPIGEMTGGYVGEPHDGVFALSRYCKKISYTDSLDNKLMSAKNYFNFDFEEKNVLKIDSKIMEKSDFHNLEIDQKFADLYFYSGGSSGEPKLSVFTYEDYHRQMEVAADGLFASGLNPKTDRCMNLFYAGNLYGGFLSFFTILEKLKAVHFPMGANSDFLSVGQTIVKNKVDTLLGMPSYLVQLFSNNNAFFKDYRGIKKIFYGGEHLGEAQKKWLENDFGVELIRSASYGSVDAGPLGYQCPFSLGGIHHLFHRLHDLEVVELDEDRPVKNGEMGRLLFTSKVRHGQKINRYAIGDIGKILEGECECGVKGTRFELLGRHGDIFRIGTNFISFLKIQKILIDKYNFFGLLQIHLYTRSNNGKEKILLQLEDLSGELTSSGIRKIILSNYIDLLTAVKDDLVLDFEVEIIKSDKFFYTPNIKKFKNVVDHRF